MKKLNLLLITVLLVGLVAITGCDKKNDPTKDFKNPKTITVDTNKGITKITYDDDGTYEEDESGDEKILKNSDGNFRFSFEYQDLTSKEADNRKNNFSKDKNYKVLSDVEFNGYKGFVIVDKTWATSQVYLYLDEENDVIFLAKVSPTKSNETAEALKTAKNPEDVLYNLDKVQQTLKTITYSKEKK